jgi:predicted nucleotidyltransferase
MDFLETSLVDFWRCLNQHNVSYIVVGGFAVNFHGYERFTGDVDLYMMTKLKTARNSEELMQILEWGIMSLLKPCNSFPVG